MEKKSRPSSGIKYDFNGKVKVHWNVCMVHMTCKRDFSENFNVEQEGAQKVLKRLVEEKVEYNKTVVALDCPVIHSTVNGVHS